MRAFRSLTSRFPVSQCGPLQRYSSPSWLQCGRGLASARRRNDHGGDLVFVGISSHSRDCLRSSLSLDFFGLLGDPLGSRLGHRGIGTGSIDVDLELRPGAAPGPVAAVFLLFRPRKRSTLLCLDCGGCLCAVLLLSFAPWEWDNMKFMLWSWLVLAPYLWTKIVAQMKLAARIAICFVLFFSERYFAARWPGCAAWIRGRPSLGT